MRSTHRFQYERLVTRGHLAGNWVPESFSTPSPQRYYKAFANDVAKGKVRNLQVIELP
jgi:hypothetical protein